MIGRNKLLGWCDKAETITKVYLNSFDNNEERLVVKGDEDYRSPWFVFHMMCQSLQLGFDQSKVKYPKGMWPYEGALNYWRITDMLGLDKMVYTMAELENNYGNSCIRK